MDLKEFVENFANQFDDTDASEIQANTVFQELEEWSSLMVIKTITGSEIRSCNTVEELYKLVDAK